MTAEPARDLPAAPLPAHEFGAPAEPAPHDALEDAKRELLEFAHAPQRPNVIQRHPWGAIAAGIIAGVVLGSAPIARTGTVTLAKLLWPQVVRALIVRRI